MDCRQDDDQNRIEYWLRILESYAGDSPVVIVGNQCDATPLDIDQVKYCRNYPAIKATCSTSCPDPPQGIDDLQKTILEQVDKLPHVRSLVPKSYLDVKTHLETMREDYISYDDYTRLCEKNGITEKESQKVLIGFLNDLGIALYYGDNLFLEDRSVLKPEWVTKGIYAVINEQSLMERDGLLSRDHLREILASVEGAHYGRGSDRFILGMMEKFELCFPVQQTQSHEFLVPDALPKDQPDLEPWEDALELEYHFSVLPLSVFSRLMVRMHSYIWSHTCWRTGVVLDDGRNRALVKADVKNKRITVAVQGEPTTRRDFMSQIRGQIESILATMGKISAKKQIPIPGHRGVFMSFNYARKLEAKGILDHHLEDPDERIIKVDLRKLLGLFINEEEWRDPRITQLLALQKQLADNLVEFKDAHHDSAGRIEILLGLVASGKELTERTEEQVTEIAEALRKTDNARYARMVDTLKKLGEGTLHGASGNAAYEILKILIKIALTGFGS